MPNETDENFGEFCLKAWNAWTLFWRWNGDWIKKVLMVIFAGFLFVQCVKAIDEENRTVEISSKKYAVLEQQVKEDPSIKHLIENKLKDKKITGSELSELKKEIEQQKRDNLKKSMMK